MLLRISRIYICFFALSLVLLVSVIYLRDDIRALSTGRRVLKSIVPDNTGDDLPFFQTEIPLMELKRSQVRSIIHRYTDTFQILCKNQLRLGTFLDGGTQVCIDDSVKPKAQCLVYSYGSGNSKISFVADVIRWFGCEVHVFDPSMTDDEWSTIRLQVPAKCKFHKIGLGREDIVLSPESRAVRTVGTTMKELGHDNRTLDILKINVEGDEWAALTQMMDSGVISRVRQLVVELHFSQLKRNGYSLGLLKRLSDTGFKIFSRERNKFCHSCIQYDETLGYEVSMNVVMGYINTKYQV